MLKISTFIITSLLVNTVVAAAHFLSVVTGTNVTNCNHISEHIKKSGYVICTNNSFYKCEKYNTEKCIGLDTVPFFIPEDFTWDDNNSGITSSNVKIADSTLILSIKKNYGIFPRLGIGDSIERHYTGAEIRSQFCFLYGRFEAFIKTTRRCGVILSFFLYRYDPWQEIDIEFRGDSGSYSIMLNKYFNSNNNSPLESPIICSLPFSTDSLFHLYSIDWCSSSVRIMIDSIFLYEYKSDIPNKPMQARMNAWVPKTENFGIVNDSLLPAKICCKWFRYISHAKMKNNRNFKVSE